MSVQHAMVPYSWRLSLGIIRAAMGVACAFLYAMTPDGTGILAAIPAGLYAVYAAAALARNQMESSVYPLSILIVDQLFFFACALHGSPQGLWLSLVCYFYLASLAALLFGWREVATVTVLSTLFFVLVRDDVRYTIWFAVVLAGIAATLSAAQKHFIQVRLSAALKRSVISRSDAETARESERERIAADFHDGPLQSFISFQMRLEIIRKLMSRDGEAALRELLELQDLGKSQITELRSFVRSMQPVEITRTGLASSIREVVYSFSRDTGIEVTLNMDELPEMEEQDAAMELLQVIREALNNARKHSRASCVNISIEAGDEAIRISVSDDGSGFPFSGAYNLDELELLRMGPKSIKRRVRSLGGEMVLDSRPSQGATLEIRIPR